MKKITPKASEIRNYFIRYAFLVKFHLFKVKFHTQNFCYLKLHRTA